MAATSSTGLIWNASISKHVQNILIYMCANFGAFRTILTIGLLCRWTISYALRILFLYRVLYVFKGLAPTCGTVSFPL